MWFVTLWASHSSWAPGATLPSGLPVWAGLPCICGQRHVCGGLTRTQEDSLLPFSRPTWACSDDYGSRAAKGQSSVTSLLPPHPTGRSRSKASRLRWMENGLRFSMGGAAHTCPAGGLRRTGSLVHRRARRLLCEQLRGRELSVPLARGSSAARPELLLWKRVI